MDEDVVGTNACDAQHCAQQRCLVFAVAVAVAENVARGMRLVTSYAYFNRDITNIRLDKVGDCPQFGIEIGFAGDHLLRFADNFGSWVPASRGQSAVPFSQGRPRPDVTFFASGEISDREPAQQYKTPRHHSLFLEA